MRASLVGLVLVGVLSACTNSNDVGDRLSLAEHRAQWERRTFTSYSFDLDQQEIGATGKVHITVNGTAVANVVDQATGLPPQEINGWPTIDVLYVEGERSLGVKGQTVRLEFDDQYNYPTLLTIANNNPGGNFAAHVSNLTPIS